MRLAHDTYLNPSHGGGSGTRADITSAELERAADARSDLALGPTLDRKGFERMVSPLLRGLRAKALRLTRNRSDADDLVQETVLRAWRFWPRYVERDNCRAWLQRILTNTFCTEHRRAGRLRAHLNEVAHAAFAIANDPPSPIVGANEAQAWSSAKPLPPVSRTSRSAHARIEVPPTSAGAHDFDPRDGDAHGLDDRMNHALTRLNAEQRRVLWLVDVRERSYREVAAELACPIGTVMSRLHRARAALRLQLGAAAAHA